MERGLVIESDGSALSPEAPFVFGARVGYYREVEAETPIPDVELVYVDDHIVVADKPPFLPVTPGGRYVRNCLLYKVQERDSVGRLLFEGGSQEFNEEQAGHIVTLAGEIAAGDVWTLELDGTAFTTTAAGGDAAPRVFWTNCLQGRSGSANRGLSSARRFGASAWKNHVRFSRQKKAAIQPAKTLPRSKSR